MKAQTYSCTMENANSQKNPTSQHNVELTDAEFDACNGLCQHHQCKAWYGNAAKLVPIEGTARELPTDEPKVGQIWRLYERPDDDILFIAAVSKDGQSVFIVNNISGQAFNGTYPTENLHRWYVLDDRF